MSQKGISGMMASLNPFAKSSKGRNGSGSTSGSRGGGGSGGASEVPRSFRINGGPARASSERLPVTENGSAEGIARRWVRVRAGLGCNSVGVKVGKSK